MNEMHGNLETPEQCRVVFEGLIEDSIENRERFVESLVSGMNVPREKAWALVQSGRACVKKACPADAAERLGERLRHWGARVAVEPLQAAPPPGTAIPARGAAPVNPSASAAIKPAGPSHPMGAGMDAEAPPEIEEIPRRPLVLAEEEPDPESEAPAEEEHYVPRPKVYETLGMDEEAGPATSRAASGEGPGTPADPWNAGASGATVEDPLASLGWNTVPEATSWNAPADAPAIPGDWDPAAAAAAGEDLATEPPRAILPPEWAEASSIGSLEEFAAEETAAAQASNPPVAEDPVWGEESLPLVPPQAQAVAGAAARVIPPPPSPAASARPALPVAPLESLQADSAGPETAIRCSECGSSEPFGARTCSRCFYPLGAKKKTRAAEARPQAAPAPAPAAVRAPALTARGHGELPQCFPVVLAASCILWGYAAVNLLSVAVSIENLIGAGLVSSVIDIVLGIGLMKGSGGARIWVLVRSILGGVLWGGFLAMTGDLFGAGLQVFYSVSLVILLTGTGSLVKALLFGVPNALLVGLAALGMLIGGGMAEAGEPTGQMMRGLDLLDEENWTEAALAFEAALGQIPESDAEGRAKALLHLGAAYIGDERYGEAIPELQKSIALDDSVADSHFLLAMGYFGAGRPADALRELERVGSLQPAYPGLEDTRKMVQSSITRTFY